MPLPPFTPPPFDDDSPAAHALKKLRDSLPLRPYEVANLRECLTNVVTSRPDLPEAKTDLKTLDTAYPPVTTKTADVVNHPSHYTAGGVECIDAIAAATTGLEGIEAACTANAIKYLWRWKRKNGLEDLRKARWYINHLLGDN